MNARVLVPTTLLAALAVALPADGQTDKPAPCLKYVAEDPAGDQRYGLAGNFSPAPAPDSTDVRGIFFNSTGGKVTLNIQLTEAVTEAPAGTQGIVYRFLYSKPDTLFLDVEVGLTGVTYSYGHFETGPVGDGETTGTIHEGPDGVISVNLPPSHGGKAGMKLAGNLFSSISTGAILASTDYAPDEGDFTYDGAECPGSPEPVAPPSATPAPGGPVATPEPTGPQNQPLGKLAVKASPSKLKAGRKKATFKLTASEEITSLTAKLTRRGKAVGTGSLARLSGTAKLKLKLKGKLKKGSHQLVLNGRKADGTNGAAVFKIKVGG